MDKEQSKKLAFIIQMQDQKLTKEHRWELNKNNRCNKCYILKTINGKCSMGCDD